VESQLLFAKIVEGKTIAQISRRIVRPHPDHALNMTRVSRVNQRCRSIPGTA
jgi:hypothetical protein